MNAPATRAGGESLASCPDVLISTGKESVRFGDVVEALSQNGSGVSRLGFHRACRQQLPSRSALIEVVEALRSVLFPGYFGVSDLTDDTRRFHVGATLDRTLQVLREQIKRGLCFTCASAGPDCGQCDQSAEDIAEIFLSRLPEIRRLLAGDVAAGYEGDPAATCPDEVIFCYPGLTAITNHRIAHEFYRLKVPVIARIIAEHAHSITGIDIHPGASIGERFFIDHGSGVVIGETCVIGNNVRLYQGVTLGAKSFPLDANGNPLKGIPRHPIVEDDVIIYAGATVLGRVTVGRGSVIGGNVWLTRGVPPGSRVAQAQTRDDVFTDGAGI